MVPTWAAASSFADVEFAAASINCSAIVGDADDEFVHDGVALLFSAGDDDGALTVRLTSSIATAAVSSGFDCAIIIRRPMAVGLSGAVVGFRTRRCIVGAFKRGRAIGELSGTVLISFGFC